MLVLENQNLSLEQMLKEHNLYLLSEEEYKEYIKLKSNMEYLKKIDESIAQLQAGLGHEHELIEVE